VVKFVSSLVPRKISNKLNSRFNTKQMIFGRRRSRLRPAACLREPDAG
jgi:hypothetical protein